MSCKFDKDTIEAVTSFHGHFCPGLAIGIRASELGLELLGKTGVSERVAVVETDMCGVDAIQFLTGCTFGKGNLVHLDYGKMAFSFFERGQKQGVRLVLNSSLRGELGKKMSDLMSRSQKNELNADETKLLSDIRADICERYMMADLKEMFAVNDAPYALPRGPKILQSLTCEVCGDATMESRTRRFDSKVMCIPCFAKFEQKVFG